jgi:hypothetical protein
MPRPFAVLRARGAGWDDSRPLDGQRDWPAHAAFMDVTVKECWPWTLRLGSLS